ncbi:MAG: flagellar hook-basal body complex protein FliE [Bacillaceae bacterium]|nr:flagellar hook-basal body complex protein FliE [Bacillaceae bacterium]
MEIHKIGALANVNPPSQVNKYTVREAAASFSDFLNQSIEKVNRAQLEAEIMTEKLAAGEVQDVHQVMLAEQKAMLSLQLTLEVRNKAVEAYQEIMRMQF